MPVEGGARVAIIEGADRMNEDAQSALLKTLEEPPAGVTIVLCADQRGAPPADRPIALLPGPPRARRAARHRGDPRRPRPGRSADRGPARAGWPAAGPGLALAYARAPEAVLIRAELTRVLLDLTDARPSARLAAARAAIPRAMALSAALSAAGTAGPPARPTRRRGRAARPRRRLRHRRPTDAADDDDADGRPDERGRGPATHVPATERRRGVEILLGLWADVARDLVLVGVGRRPVGPRHGPARGARRDRRPRSRRAPPRRSSSARARSAELLAANVSPELILDSLVLAWPRAPAPLPDRRRCAGRRTVDVRLDATVIGRVQGVGFRYFVLREAMDLGLDGWVANTPDGSRPVRRRGPARAPRDACSSGCARARRRPSSSA